MGLLSKSAWSGVKATQLCLTLCDPMDSTVHGILQARILQWITFPFSRGSSQPRDQTQVSLIARDSLPAEPQGKPQNLLSGYRNQSTTGVLVSIRVDKSTHFIIISHIHLFSSPPEGSLAELKLNWVYTSWVHTYFGMGWGIQSPL